jgi:hypothetical protein
MAVGRRLRFVVSDPFGGVSAISNAHLPQGTTEMIWNILKFVGSRWAVSCFCILGVCRVRGLRVGDLHQMQC